MGPRPVRVGRRGRHITTVRDILTWPGFDVELVAGSLGLDRPVRMAHATELIDPRMFLRGDELILTVGSELSDAAACQRFVAHLLDSGAAGIALAIEVEGHDSPEDLAPAAEKAGLAMFTVPPSLPFVAFTEKFQELADERHEYERLRHEDGRMLDYVRRGYASPHIFRERFPEIPGAAYMALCLPEQASVELEGVILEGWIENLTVVVADELFVRRFSERSDVQMFGIGSAVPLSGLARTIKEAMATLAMSARRGSGAGPRDLSTFPGLIERLTPEQAAPFRDHVTGPLLKYDAQYGRSLWPTLLAYVNSGASVTRTAKEMSIHANSVRNRLNRIAELTGLDPHSLEDQFALAVAVRMTTARP
ncbi:PucR family transcriptional regulator [Citricoccus sp. GCM10030269]|uniref:PucR family transcriptional regulator n=1 Tax=Citricoccus sp. GCM10030269 TaxID=3273388 RepID=UPI00361DC3C0